MKKKKERTVAYLKNKVLWPLFSKYIRWKYAVGDKAICCTCKEVFPIKKLQAGHFIPGRHNSILFDERNVHPQCYRCNVCLKGNSIEYYAFMQEKYGQEVIDELRALDKEIKQYKRYEIEELIEQYKKRLALVEGSC